MPKIWRAMINEGGIPQVGRGASCLGVRIGGGKHDDFTPDGEGNVHPGSGGMSVSPNVDALPVHRLPRRLREVYPDRFKRATASNRMHCWEHGDGAFDFCPVAHKLFLRPDPDKPKKHGLVEPDVIMPLADFEAALASTRDQWLWWQE